MAATLTVENIFQQQDINVRKQLFNECLAHIILMKKMIVKWYFGQRNRYK